MLLLEELPTEILVQIFLSCSSINDTVHLSSTCRHFRRIFSSPRHLLILFAAADAQYGPIQDVIQLVTYNASQPAHLIRTVPTSLALLKQVVSMGRIAQKWESIYPFKKWKDNFEDRRFLTPTERYSLRRALYRLWLYSRAFHNALHPRTSRLARPVITQRAPLLHNWSNAELAEMADVQGILRDVIRSNICPSNGTIARKFRKRFPDAEHQLMFDIHLNYPPPVTAFSARYDAFQLQQNNTPLQVSGFRNTDKYRSTAFHEPGGEGWGDDIPHYYVVEDMLKLDPEQILWLKENAPLKGQVEMFVRGLGEWFNNNGETFGQTLEWVIGERGADVAEFMEAIVEGEMGIARGEV